jgi:hypothetical protein
MSGVRQNQSLSSHHPLNSLHLGCSCPRQSESHSLFAIPAHDIVKFFDYGQVASI